MKFTQYYKKTQIPQWKSCYLDYQHLKIWVKIIRDTVREKLDLQDILSYGVFAQLKSETGRSLTRSQIDQGRNQTIRSYRQYFDKQSHNAGQIFKSTHYENMIIFGKFVNWKFKQIQTNFHVCWIYHFVSEEGGQKIKARRFILYLEYLFVQSIYLVRMIQSTFQAEKRILQKHKLYARDVFLTPQPLTQQLINIDNCHLLRRSIQRFIFRINQKSRQKIRYRLRKLAEKFELRTKQSLIIGILVGAILTVIIFMCVILSRAQITLQSNPVFNMNFTLFRGIAYALFYIWILGINLLFYENYGISHRIILQNNYTQYPHSADLFQIAGVFSVLFVVVFTIYALNLSGLIQLSFSAQTLPLFVWLLFLIFLFNPFPIFYFYGRVYFFKLVIKVFMSIFIPINFPIVWGTVQAISLLNIFQDLFYAACYTITHINKSFPLNNTIQPNVCRPPAIQARFIYTVVVYSIRVIQCFKVGFVQQKKVQFINGIKFSVSLITAILAYQWQSVQNNHVFPAWVVFAVLNTLGSFSWDLKISWDLLQTKSKNKLLRNNLIYPKKNYYVWIVINFILRSAWTFNISPNIIRNFFISPQLFAITFAFLQIFRRGVWNLVRVQVQQIRNNEQFRAFPKNQQKIQKQLYEFVSKYKDRLDPISIQQLVKAGQQIVENQRHQKQHLVKIKQQIQKQVQQFKQKLLKQYKQGKQKDKQVQKYVRQLLENVY